jgi:hypothetical protein
MRQRIVGGILLSLILGMTGSLAAQTDQTGVLEGRVLDPSGQPVPNVDITVAQADGSYPSSVVTDGAGRFRVGFLPPGLYIVRAQAVGYRPVQATDVRIRAAQVTPLRLEMPAAVVALDPLVVTMPASQIDAVTTEYSSSLEADVIRLLPLPTRSATALVEFTPGARADQVWGGSTEQANAYHLDGVSVNQPGFGGDFLLPNVDWLDEIVVTGLGAGAEYGGFQGGLINMVTKSGTNTLQGGLRFNYANQALNATNINAYESGDDQYDRWELNADVRGPILRDRLYFFLSAQQSRDNTRVVDLTSATPDSVTYIRDPNGDYIFEERTARKLLGKLTWQFTDKDQLNALFGKDDIFTENRGLNSFDSPETVTKQESPAWFFNAGWRRNWGANHLTELKVTGYQGRDDRLPLSGDTLPGVTLLGGNRNSYTNATYTRLREPDNIALSFNWDSYWTTGPLQHRLKVGGDYRQGWWDERRARNGNLTWRPDEDETVFDPSDPATWDFISSDWGGDINLDARSTNAAVYIQDYIEISRHLRVSPGARLGLWRGYLTPGDGASPEFRAVDDTRIAPRIGATIDPTGDGRFVLKGHWGRYYQDMFALIFDRAAGGNVFTDIEYWDWIDPGLPDVTRPYTLEEREQLFDFFGSQALGGEVGPVVDYRQPYVDQITAGFEFAFTRNWKLEAVYVNRRNADIVALVDRNLATNYTKFENIQVFEYPSGDPVLNPSGDPLVLPEIYISNDDILYVGDAPGLTPEQIDALTYEDDLVLTNVPEAERTMDQVQLTVEGRSSIFTLQASVVWTDLRGNFYSVSGYDDPFGTGVGPFVHPNEQFNFYGKLPNYATWEGKFRATAQLPLFFRAGAYLSVTSGDRYAPQFGIDRRNHDYVTADGEFLDPDLIFGIDGETIYLEERGSRTYDPRFLLDLHIDKVVPLREIEWVIALDVFNVFNTDAVTSVKTFVNDQITDDPTTAFEAVRFRLPPRTIRLSTALNFF